jgi:hypothetical protein
MRANRKCLAFLRQKKVVPRNTHSVTLVPYHTGLQYLLEKMARRETRKRSIPSRHKKCKDRFIPEPVQPETSVNRPHQGFSWPNSNEAISTLTRGEQMKSDVWLSLILNP